jgi:hypothetical protein
MQAQHAKLIEALEQVESFLVQNRDRLESVITSVQHENFSASRNLMVEYMTAQNSSLRNTRATTALKRSFRNQLIAQHMRPIAIIARAQLPDSAELNALTVPVGTRKFVDLVAAGYGMAKAASVHQETFLAAGLPQDFIEQLVKAADALKQAITEKGNTIGLRAKATEGLAKEARNARTSLRLLDTLIRAVVRDSTILAQWRTIRRGAVAATSAKALGDAPAPVEATADDGSGPSSSGGSRSDSDGSPVEATPVVTPVTEAPAAA